jgi:short-subunit dehydrogenase
MSLPVPGPDRTALVTGASSGIGVELARQLAGRGHGVTLVARREDKLRALADELAASSGVRTEVIAADLTDPASRDGVVRELAARGLEVDVLVNNAGFSTMGPVYRSDPEREVAMVRTDVEAVVHLCSALTPGMVARGRGAVLNVASTAAFQPIPGQAGYAASKAFVLSYSRAIGQELKGTGVTVTTLCPGPVETGFAEAAGLGDEAAGEAMPKFMWVSAAAVAKAAVDALDKGRPVVIPGTANRALASVSHHSPRRLLLTVLARQHPALKD